jgi:transposase
MARSRGKKNRRRGAGKRKVPSDVQLSRYDLSQLDEDYLAKLPEQQLRYLSAKLLADLKAAHERLDQNPSNSSRPPSSRDPWQSEDREDTPKQPEQARGEEEDSDTGQGKEAQKSPQDSAGGQGQSTEPTQQRRAGQRPGAPGHGRMQQLPIEQTHHHYPETCAGCGAALAMADASRPYAGYLMIDLVAPSSERAGLEVFQSKHLYYEHDCPCGHRTRAEPGHCAGDPAWSVALSERHLAGPMLVALICALSLRMRLSRRRIQEFFADWFALQLSVATINQCLHEAARALEPVVEEQLLAEIRDSDLLHADETSWKEHGQLLWLWVFTSATTTVFTIGRRTQELLHGMLGTALDGWLMSDGYWAYRDYDNRLRCLTHLLRKARGLEDSLDRQARDFGKTLRRCLQTVMDAVYAAREGPPPIPLRQQHAKQLNALLDLCLDHTEAKHEKTRSLARELLNDWNTYWIVLDHPELPLTNNAAERALRHWVIARRISYGTRNRQGSRAFTLLASVIETCRQRGHSPWSFIAETLRERRRGNPVPVLPAAIS